MDRVFAVTELLRRRQIFLKNIAVTPFKKKWPPLKRGGDPRNNLSAGHLFFKSMPHDDPPTSNLLQWPKIQSSPNERVTAHVCHEELSPVGATQ